MRVRRSESPLFGDGRSMRRARSVTLQAGDNDRSAIMKKTGFTPKELNDGFVVAITIEAKPGEADTVAAVLASLVAPTMEEPGVKLFLPYRSPTNPSLFFIFELYADESGWAAHQETAHFKAAVGKFLPLVSRRERIPFIPYAPVLG
jgi:quinol monooxygenase YgiN